MFITTEDLEIWAVATKATIADIASDNGGTAGKNFDILSSSLDYYSASQGSRGIDSDAANPLILLRPLPWNNTSVIYIE